MNRAYGLDESRPFWKLRLIAVLLVVMTALTTTATLVLVVFGAPLGEAIANKAHLGTVWDISWAILRWPVTLTAALTFFALVYYLAPNTNDAHVEMDHAGRGRRSLLWLALSGLFAVYATFSGSYSRTYGALAAGVILLLWLNYTAWSILYGAELNDQFKKQVS